MLIPVFISGRINQARLKYNTFILIFLKHFREFVQSDWFLPVLYPTIETRRAARDLFPRNPARDYSTMIMH